MTVYKGTRTPEMPEKIGPYRILDQLGEGGMAVVYLAEQTEPVRRRIALKILKPGMDTRQVIARFESERQALAVLDHPNIAKVFDGGVTEHGRPYFVMELVRGVPINEYCDNNRLRTEERVKLFIDVCSAVQHAHHKGLIHRDLKPSNLLVGVVDGRPEVKVIDFGIAKASGTTLSEKTLVTRIGQIIGTPQYMSPEQADSSGMDVDTRTDIYSLGVVLYEMLVGIVPLNLAAIGDAAMRIALREKDPPKPSTRITELGDTRDEIAKARGTDPQSLRKQLKGDLDWIVMQAIAKDRTERYETANALAMDCQRFLGHQPVLARPPSASYLVRRFVKRNKLMVSAATIAAVAIIVGAGAATIGFIRATEAEQVARREAATANEITSFLVDLFQVSNPYATAPISHADAANVTAREILDMGAERIRNDLQNQPQLQSGLMTIMGRVFLGLGLLDRASPLIEEALEIRREFYGNDHIAVGDSMMAMGLYHLLKGEYAQAANLQGEAISIHENAWGSDAPGIAWMLSRQAVTLTSLGRLEEALAIQLRAIEMIRASEDQNPYAYGQALNNLGYVQNGLTQFEDAAGTFGEAISVLEDTEYRGMYSRALANLAAAYMQMGRVEDSRDLHEEALALRREIYGPEHNETGFSVANLAFLYQYLGNYARAEEYARESIRIFSAQLGERHPNIGIILGGLGWTLHLQGKFDEAESTLREALTILRESVGPDNIQAAQVHNALGETYSGLGRFKLAESEFRESLRILGQLGIEHAHEGRALIGLAKLDESSLNHAERLRYFDEGLEIMRNTEGLGTPDAAEYQIAYGTFLMQQGEEVRARETFQAGLRNLAGALPRDNPRFQVQAKRYEELFGMEPP